MSKWGKDWTIEQFRRTVSYDEECVDDEVTALVAEIHRLDAQIKAVREAIEYAEEWAEALDGKNASTPVVPCADLRAALDGDSDA